MSYSQYSQDLYLDKNIFKGFKNGIFVDVGAHDGISLNNTLYFEKKSNWNGINIEPIKNIYDLLVSNRPNCININSAIFDKEIEVDFIQNTGYTEMLSGIKETYHIKHKQRLDREIISMGGKSEIIKIKTKRLENILDENKITHVNLLSIDVEGAEFEVIKSIDFDKVFIDVIVFESNYKDTSKKIIDYLVKKNFKIIKISQDIFMINLNSNFL